MDRKAYRGYDIRILQGCIPVYGQGSKELTMKAPKHIRQAKAKAVQECIAKNKALPKELRESSKGYRMSPSPTISHKISMHPGRGAGRNAKCLTSLAQCLVETKGISDRFVSPADKHLTPKQRATKYRERGPYKSSQRKDQADNRCMVRVGTIPAHYVPIKDKDTGETKVVLVKEQPKWKEVGLP